LQTTEAADRSGAASQRLLHALAAATFFIFFQAFMIAPLVPALARIFSTEATVVGLAVPAYLVPTAP
jgi:predicted MFS family arabinose efflux permease